MTRRISPCSRGRSNPRPPAGGRGPALQLADCSARRQNCIELPQSEQPAARIIAPMSRIRTLTDKATTWIWSAMEPGGTRGVVGALCLVVGITVLLETIKYLVELPPIIITYLIPVLIAAIRWGYISAFVATVTGASCAAFFFYRPLYTFYVEDPARRLGILIFAVVAAVAAHLAVRMRRESEIVRKREKEISDLYAFSRRLAGARSASDIFDAIQKHLFTTGVS